MNVLATPALHDEKRRRHGDLSVRALDHGRDVRCHCVDHMIGRTIMEREGGL
jgi:hypothetical protein